MPVVNSIDGDVVQKYLAQLQRCHEKRTAIGTDVRSIFDEAESEGIDRAALKRLFAKTKLSPEERRHRDFLDAILERSINMEQLDLPFDEVAQSFAKPTTTLEDTDRAVAADQAKAAKPVDGDAPRRGGRPKGSKNKTKGAKANGKGNGHAKAPPAAAKAAERKTPAQKALDAAQEHLGNPTQQDPPPPESWN